MQIKHRRKLQKSKSSLEIQHDYVGLPQIAQNTNTSVTDMPWWSLPLTHFFIASNQVYCCSCNRKCRRTVIKPLAPWQQKLYLNQLEKLSGVIPLLPLFIPKFIPIRDLQYFKFLHWKVFSAQVFSCMALKSIISSCIAFSINSYKLTELHWDLQNCHVQISS